MPNILHPANIRKTLSYLAKNGLRQTYYAARERGEATRRDKYDYLPPSAQTLTIQREQSAAMSLTFSIVVPVYDPRPGHFQAMLESVLAQSYPHFELILADAGENAEIAALAAAFKTTDARIKYLRLPENKGISANTNAALAYASGDYVGLLDHDDLLAPDALHEMAAAIQEADSQNKHPLFLYSDEDKCSQDDAGRYSCHDYHQKPELNLDLLLSNNYICHFLVMRRELIHDLGLRSAYDGAQDYDLVLRAMDRLLGPVDGPGQGAPLQRARAAVIHVPRVLYHWRSHPDSTAENTRSKAYAYEAGRRAVADFIHRRGICGTVSHGRHLGFYRVDYEPDILSQRPEVGVVGGRLMDKKNKITGGIYAADGTALYHGLHKRYSGYMHRAQLQQEAAAVDIRCMRISPLLYDIFEAVCGQPYLPQPNSGHFDWCHAMEADTDFKQLSLTFCEKVRAAGFLVVWDPRMQERI